MKGRLQKKREARWRRGDRWHLVHLAGCVVCRAEGSLDAEDLAVYRKWGVKIPRSLRLPRVTR